MMCLKPWAVELIAPCGAPIITNKAFKTLVSDDIGANTEQCPVCKSDMHSPHSIACSLACVLAHTHTQTSVQYLDNHK